MRPSQPSLPNARVPLDKKRKEPEGNLVPYRYISYHPANPEQESRPMLYGRIVRSQSTRT